MRAGRYVVLRGGRSRSGGCGHRASRAPEGSCTGTTSQTGRSVRLKVSKGGATVKGFRAGTSTTCTKGTAVREIQLHANPTPDMQIGKSGPGFHNNFDFANLGRTLSGEFTSKRKATGSFDFPCAF